MSIVIVPYEYKIVESALNIIYCPVSDKLIIMKITVQEGNLIDFTDEEIKITLHIQEKYSNGLANVPQF